MSYLSIRNMNWSMSLREALEEDYWQQVREKRRRQREWELACGLMDILETDDPQWEAWFNATITDDTSVAKAIELIRRRILDVAASKYGVMARVNCGELLKRLEQGCKGDPEVEQVVSAVVCSSNRVVHGGHDPIVEQTKSVP